MSAPNWSEIKSRAIAFANEWQGEASERAEAQSFWNEFFQIFGVHRRRVAAYEAAVKKQIITKVVLIAFGLANY